MSSEAVSDDVIIIEFGVRRHGRDGWLPVVTCNGKDRAGWSPNAFDRDSALLIARGLADEEAGRYIGDWKITVTRRDP